MFCSSEQNARTLLSIAEQRRQHWANLIGVMNGLVVTLTLGIWTFFIKEFLDKTVFINNSNPQPFAFSFIILAAGLSCSVLGLWRYYVHELDNNIVKIYPEIFFYEGILGVPSDMGIRNYLSSEKNVGDYLSTFGRDKQLKELMNLIRIKRIGRRGHLKFDVLVFVLDVLFILLIVFGICSPFGYWDIPRILNERQWLNSPLLILAGAGALLILLGIVIQIRAFLIGQKCCPLAKRGDNQK